MILHNERAFALMETALYKAIVVIEIVIIPAAYAINIKIQYFPKLSVTGIYDIHYFEFYIK